jgi:uncharacterized membrane protein
VRHPLEPALQRQVDAYLKRLRDALGELPASEASDIVREIQGHIIERIESMNSIDEDGLTAILDALGNPEAIASLYESRAMVARARTSRSPLLILRTTLRWAGRSVAGLAMCLFAVFGYVNGLSCLVGAAMKILHPDRVGLWIGPNTWNLSLGYLTAAERVRDHAHEILGGSFIPIMLIVGPIILIVTTVLVGWTLQFAFPSPDIVTTR